MSFINDLDNLSRLNAYDRRQSSVNPLDWTVATVAHMGTSIWNSVTFGQAEVSTEALLGKLGMYGAIDAYNTHRDSVELASFVGGVIIPGMAAVKLTKAVRDGNRAFNALSTQGKVADTAKITKLIEDGKKGQAEYRKVRNGMIAKAQVNNLADTVAAELAIMGTMNAHPFMEDYMANPVENFGIGLVLGGGLTAPLAAIGTRSALRGAASAAETDAWSRIANAASMADTKALDTASLLNTLTRAADDIEHFVAQDTVNVFTKEIGLDYAAGIRAKAGELAKQRLPKNLDLESANYLKDIMAKNSRMLGVDKLDFFKPEKKGILAKVKAATVGGEARPTFVTKAEDGSEVFHSTFYYSQDHGGSFIPPEHVNNLASAADTATAETISARAAKFSVNEPRSTVDNLAAASSADVEIEYLARIKFYNDLSPEDFAKASIVGDDLPAIHGWFQASRTKMSKLGDEIAALDPLEPNFGAKLDELTKQQKLIRDAELTIYKGDQYKTVHVEQMTEANKASFPADTAKYSNTIEDILETSVDPLVKGDFDTINDIVLDYYSMPASDKLLGGAMPTDMRAWNRVSPAKRYNFFTERASDPETRIAMSELFPDGTAAGELSDRAKLALALWIGGNESDKIALRAGFESARTLRKGLTSDTMFHREWEEILGSRALREQRPGIAKMANEQGNVFLWRGTAESPTGQSSFSSFSHYQGAAETFGEATHYYSIHSDDIIGYLYHGEREFLIGATTRDTVGTVNQNTGALDAAKNAIAGPKNPSVKLGRKEAFSHYMDTTTASIRSAVKGGTPIEVAALRHNMTVDQASAFMATDRNLAKTLSGQVRDDLADADTYSLMSRWQTPDQLGEALGMERRMLTATAKERNHMGIAGGVQDVQRKAIAEHATLSKNYREAINMGDNLAAENIRAKLNTYEHLYLGAQEEFINLSMTTSGSAMAREMTRRILSNDALTTLKAGLHEAVNSVGGNSMVSSADMVMRNMDQIGRLVAHLGDTRATVVNQAIQEHVKPITDGFRQIGKNPAARTEFALVDQFRQSNRGPLFFDFESGRFYRELDEATGLPMELIGPEINSTEVKSLMRNIVRTGDELYQARVTATQLGNTNAPENIGLWIPSNRLLGKEYAYVKNLNDGSVKLLVGDTIDDLSELKTAYKLGPDEKIISRSRAELENLAVMDDGRIQKVTLADVDKAKKGIGLAVPDISTLRLEDIAQGYIAQFNRLSTGIMEQALHPVVSKLEAMSAINQQAVKDTGKSGWRKAVAQLQSKDTAADVLDYLLGRNPAGRSEVMRSINQTADTVISYAAQSASKAWEIVRPSRLGDPVDYQKYSDALEAAGIKNPFVAFADADRATFFAKAKASGYQRDPQRVVNAFNALASTTALKFLEIAQPMINVLSMPILMSSSISRMANVKDLNAAGLFENSQMAIMMSGIRRMNSKHPTNVRLFKMAQEEGLLTSQISEVDAALNMAKLHQDVGAISKLESVLNSKFIEVASKPSEFGENLGRQWAFGTGIDLAYRQLGANASDTQVLIFARDFMKQSVGNYSASQRPAMFQGSFGSAMGLFQTYMVTYAQNMYSHIEKADRVGLTKLMLAQGGLFGTYSLPGFNPISEVIGANFSDDHIDLKTGLYRAMPDALASTIVYGLPSNILGALHTRGDVSPRIPSGFHEFVAPSMVMQYAETVVNVGKAAMRFDENAGAAMLEALSIQSTSRPIARLSELANGYSVTKAGKMIAGTEEVWSFQGIMSRLLSTRPLNEAKAREVMHLNTIYGQKDRDLRQQLVKSMKQDLRNGGLSNSRLDYYAHEYLRSGSPQGFKAAVNEAFLSNENQGIIDLTGTLKDSPLTMLLDDIDL